MCSVIGFLATGSRPLNVPAAQRKLGEVLARASERGRDSYGIVALDREGRFRAFRRLGAPEQTDTSWSALIDHNTSILIANTRAEPTTEFVYDKAETDVQPFQGRSFVVSHNGTIANDSELAQRYGIARATPIDSAVIPPLFDVLGVLPGLQQIQGSYSIAAADRREPGTLHLARNFKPLVYQMDAETGALWFASSEDYLHPGYEHFLDPNCARIVNVPPYTYLRIDGRAGRIESSSLWANSHIAPRRTLVVASGGLDSTVVAAMLHASGREVALLHIRYGCHAERREAQAVRQVARHIGVKSIFIDAGWLGELGASSLTENRPIAPGPAGAELPHEWVPARNMLMIATACAVADARGYDSIALGTNLEEGGAYPDNTQEFIRAMSRASSIGTLARPVVEDPLGNLVKHEIVRLGLQLGAPLHLTWSCYRNGPQHCGQCGPCFMRKTAFRMNGMQDPLHYLDEQDVAAESYSTLAVGM